MTKVSSARTSTYCRTEAKLTAHFLQVWVKDHERRQLTILTFSFYSGFVCSLQTNAYRREPNEFESLPTSRDLPSKAFFRHFLNVFWTLSSFLITIFEWVKHGQDGSRWLRTVEYPLADLQDSDQSQ